MRKLNAWTWVWLAALIAVISGELYAVFNKTRGDTISENVWLLTLAKNPWIHWPVRLVILFLFAWLLPHFWFGIWR